MLRLRLFYGLLTIILLLWSVGAAALILMRDSVARSESRLQTDYRTINAAQTLRALTSTLNTRYLPPLAGPPLEQPVDRKLYDEVKKEVEDMRKVIRQDTSSDEHWQGVVSRLELVLSTYDEGYETYFSGTAISRGEREKLLQFISMQTQRITDL